MCNTIYCPIFYNQDLPNKTQYYIPTHPFLMTAGDVMCGSSAVFIIDLKLMINPINQRDQILMSQNQHSQLPLSPSKNKTIKKTSSKRSRKEKLKSKQSNIQPLHNYSASPVKQTTQLSLHGMGRPGGRAGWESVYKNIAEMQEAIQQQQAQYARYFSSQEERALSECCSLNLQWAQERAVNWSEYFSALLEDPRDKENMLFSCETLEGEKEGEGTEGLGDYDVSEYFDV